MKLSGPVGDYEANEWTEERSGKEAALDEMPSTCHFYFKVAHHCPGLPAVTSGLSHSPLLHHRFHMEVHESRVLNDFTDTRSPDTS